MTRPSHGSPCLLLALLLAVSACELPEKPTPVTPTPVDPPPAPRTLATFEGQLSQAPEARVDGPVRLALAWYPKVLADEEATQLSQPSGLLTEDIAYEGSLPRAYRFEVQAPPPANALVSLGEGMRGKGALGILLAYQDGNANARLDTIPAEGSPIDHVVGASGGWTASPAFFVVYLDTEQDAATGLTQGFNLVKLTDLASTVVPLSTPIPLVLSGGPGLDAFVCDAVWSDTDLSKPCGLGGITEPPPEESTLRVMGSMVLRPERSQVEFIVFDDGTVVKDAQVTLGGETLPYDPYNDSYRPAVPGSLLGFGPMELRVVSGGKELRRTLFPPSDFEMTSPTSGARVPSGTPLSVSWTSSAQAQAYTVALDTNEASPLAEATTGQLEHTFEPVSRTGRVTLRVEAVAWPEDNERLGFIELKVVREQPLAFTLCDGLTTPGESGFRVEGEVEVYDEGTHVNLRVSRELLNVEDAQVLLDGEPVPYRAELGGYSVAYTGAWELPPSGLLELHVASGGEEVCRTLAIPGSFDVTAPASVRSGAPFEVLWTRSAGASVYNVGVELTNRAQLAGASTSALGHTFNGVEHSGMVLLRTEAVSRPEENGRLGWLDVKRVRVGALTFTP